MKLTIHEYYIVYEKDDQECIGVLPEEGIQEGLRLRNMCF